MKKPFRPNNRNFNGRPLGRSGGQRSAGGNDGPGANAPRGRTGPAGKRPAPLRPREASVHPRSNRPGWQRESPAPRRQPNMPHGTEPAAAASKIRRPADSQREREDGKIRLQKFMADAGIASRRHCEVLIIEGHVRVNGSVVTRLPVLIDPAVDHVAVDDALVDAPEPQGRVYYLLNKPKGILVTNYDPEDRKTVSELLTGVKERVFPVGRLDMDSRGLLLLTNDGDLANRLTHPRYGVEKTYIVEVDGKLSAGAIDTIRRGVWLGADRSDARGTRTEGFRLKLVGRERGRTILEVRITEGRNREIRRVMARVGHAVRDLNRVAIAGKLTIARLPVGAYRPLTPAEVEYLRSATTRATHDAKREATQAWYEKKEMEKERRRLEKSPGHGAP